MDGAVNMDGAVDVDWNADGHVSDIYSPALVGLMPCRTSGEEANEDSCAEEAFAPMVSNTSLTCYY